MIEINFMIADNPFQLSHDGFQFVVSEQPYIDKRTGSQHWKTNHFYLTLAGVAHYLVERGLYYSEAKTLEELGEEIKRSETALKEALSERE
jgi:hypothetical protein